MWLAGSAAVAAGAIGTHVLEETLELPADKLQTYEVAVRYQMYHALALIARWSSWPRSDTRAGSRLPARLSCWASCSFRGGIYAWLATGIKPFVHVVPVGGMAWILGWLLLAMRRAASLRARIRPDANSCAPTFGRRFQTAARVRRQRALPTPWPIACGRRAAAA